MGDAERRVSRAASDAREGGRDPYGDMMWDGDMLVPRQYDSPLDQETLDERHAHGMGPAWEERRVE